MTATSAPTLITAPHREILKASGISRTDAEAWGIRSIVDDDGFEGTDLQGVHTEGKKGLLFPLRRADGTITYQLRLDEPENDRKYIQAGGTGSIINVPDQSKAKLDAGVDHVVIVEGTKQTIVSTLLAPDDVAVVGIQGCRNWSKDGVVVPDMTSVLYGRKRVTIALDADRTTNANVYDAAIKLKETAGVLGVKDVRFVTIPAGGKAGIDDFLGMQDEGLRASIFANLLEGAKTTPGKRPAAKTLHVTVADSKRPYMLPDEAVMKLPTPRGEKVVAEFAAWVSSTTTATDDPSRSPGLGHSDVMHKVTIAIRNEHGEVQEYVIPDVPDSLLTRRSGAAITAIERLLARVPDAVGTRVSFDPSKASMIVNLIKSRTSGPS